jgi:hypothetical protein
MDQSILLILVGHDCGKAAEAAFRQAILTSRKVRVLQILASDLYHYGHHDLVAARSSKREFLLHIREELLERGKATLQNLEEQARDMGILLETTTVESEDFQSATLAEAKMGYDVIFLPKQEKKLFPLFKRTLAEYLQRRLPGRIVAC